MVFAIRDCTLGMGYCVKDLMFCENGDISEKDCSSQQLISDCSCYIQDKTNASTSPRPPMQRATLERI